MKRYMNSLPSSRRCPRFAGLRRSSLLGLLVGGLLTSTPAFSNLHAGTSAALDAAIRITAPVRQNEIAPHPLKLDYLTVSRSTLQACEKSPVVSIFKHNDSNVFIDLVKSMHRTSQELARYIRTGLVNHDYVTLPPLSLKDEPSMPALQMAFESRWLVETFESEDEKATQAMPDFDVDSPQGEFLSEVWQPANDAAEDVGVPATFIIAQAALETGWGRAQLVDASGRNSHNLFNIKAGRGWTGRTVSLPVREYVNGRRVVRHETFRAYDSYRAAFEDYARLLSENARYQRVLGEEDPTRFAYGLQRAGFATDPAYGRKIVSIIRRIEKEAVS